MIVRVYCESDGHARPGNDAKRRAQVATFSRQDGGRWQAPPAFTAHQRREIKNALAPSRRDGESDLEFALRTASKGAKPETFQGILQGVPPDEFGMRRRYRLKCEMCGTTVPARLEKLERLLDQLTAKGVSEISLTALAARLR